MSRARRIWKWAAGTLGVLLVVGASGIGALRLWLEHSPTLATDLVARVEARTGLEFEFERLDARLGLHGPELVFLKARLRMPGHAETIATARAGRVGLDAWRALRTGHSTAWRLVLEGAALHALVTERGVQLRGLPDFSPDDGRSPLARLPVGRYRLVDASVTVEDLRTGRPAFLLERVRLDVERDPRRVAVDGGARLPRDLGERLELRVELRGDLDDPGRIAWTSDVVARDAELAAWSAFAPQWSWLPSGGRGDLRVRADGDGRRRAAARFELDLADVAARAADGTTAVQYRRLAGDWRLARELRRNGDVRWTVAGRDLEFDPDAGRGAWRDGEFTLRWTAGGQPTRLAEFELRTPTVRLEAVAPLAAFLPPGAAREAATALAPRGTLARVDLRATRGAGAAEWRIDGGLQYAGLGTGAWRGVPGVGGVDGELVASGNTLRIAARSDAFAFDLPRYLAAPVGARELALTLDAWWRPDGWRFATDDLRVAATDGRGGGKARLWVPADGRSPRLVLDLELHDLEAAGVAKYLPVRRFGAPATGWLNRAFHGGRVTHATLEYAGEMRRFPFRDGGGLFRVDAQFEGLHLHYQDGWRDAEALAGRAVFENEGVAATLTAGRIGELVLTGASVAIPDFGTTELALRATARGDVRDALAYLRAAPVGPRLGEFFMALRGRGPFEAGIVLDFPLRRFAERRIEVEATLAGASARIPGLAEEVRDLYGSFRLDDRDVASSGITGTLYGGPLRLVARTDVAPRSQRVLVVEAQGRALADNLQRQFGIARGTWLEGGADWRLAARWPRFEWRPDPLPLPPDAPPGTAPRTREVQARWLPATIRIDSTLEGFGLRFPAPLAKAAAESLALRVDVAADVGQGAGSAPLPPALRERGANRESERDGERRASVVARVQLGRDAAALEWRPAPDWSFRRGTVRLGGTVPALADAPGLWVEGRTAEFDLSAWLRVKLTAGSAPGLAREAGAAAKGGLDRYLRGGRVAVQRFGIFGYAFPDVALTLDGRDGAWRARAEGPAARGEVIVPWSLPAGPPLVIDLDRLVLGARRAPVGGSAPADAPLLPTDLPALQVAVRSLDVGARRFGALEARVVRVPGGVRLERAALNGASFSANAEGDWLLAPTLPAGSETRLRGEVETTDAQDTLAAWGFAPTLTGSSGRASAELRWAGAPEGDVLARLRGTARISVQDGQLLNVQPGAGRVLGLLSIAALPRRLTLDFTDLTDQGFAFDTVTGDFEFRDGSAYTSNLLLKSPAAEIGIAGRTGLAARDYDQTAVVTGEVGGPLAAAGALAGGPVVGAAVLLFSRVFKGALGGIARGYYRITGSWDAPKIERIGAGDARAAEAAAGAVVPADRSPRDAPAPTAAPPSLVPR